MLATRTGTFTSASVSQEQFFFFFSSSVACIYHDEASTIEPNGKATAVKSDLSCTH